MQKRKKPTHINIIGQSKNTFFESPNDPTRFPLCPAPLLRLRLLLLCPVTFVLLFPPSHHHAWPPIPILVLPQRQHSPALASIRSLLKHHFLRDHPWHPAWNSNSPLDPMFSSLSYCCHGISKWWIWAIHLFFLICLSSLEWSSMRASKLLYSQLLNWALYFVGPGYTSSEWIHKFTNRWKLPM